MIRKLKLTDYYIGFMDLINYFTREPTSRSYEEFNEVFNDNDGITFVIEKDNLIIATINVFLKRKFHNNFKSIGYIGELVVHKDYRGNGYGSQLIQHSIEFCKDSCYKITLSCMEENADFYIKNNFIKKGVEMTKYF
jgi:ribosomal protein S18 acetylase RimI-like enzyme